MVERDAAGNSPHFSALRMVGAADIFRITAVCSGQSGERIARALVAMKPVPVQQEGGGSLKWEPCVPQSRDPFDVLVRVGEQPAAARQELAAQGLVELDLRSLPAAGVGISQPLALRDFSEGLNAGPWYWVELEDLRAIFAEPGRSGSVYAGLGTGDDAVARAVRAAAETADDPPWRGAASAFVTVAFAPGEHRLKESSRAFKLVREWVDTEGYCAYVASESSSVRPGAARVTVYAFHS